MRVSKLKPLAWEASIGELQNAAGNPLFRSVQLEWSQPTLWSTEMALPEFRSNVPFLYALVVNHGKTEKERIIYIGLTADPTMRFGNHNTAKKIVQRLGQAHFSYAAINLIEGENKIDSFTQALEQLEHLLIWSIDYTHLKNEKKMFTLPGMGANGGDAWHISNTGYRFSGQMHKEIVYPWMLVKPGRDRTAKPRQDT